MINIVKVTWIDEASKEAEVEVSDGVFSILCFSHPFEFNEKNEFNELIYCMNAKDIYKSFLNAPAVTKNESSYGYTLLGELIDTKNKVVKIGELKLSLSDDAIPSDIQQGDYIEFTVARLDIY